MILRNCCSLIAVFGILFYLVAGDEYLDNIEFETNGNSTINCGSLKDERFHNNYVNQLVNNRQYAAGFAYTYGVEFVNCRFLSTPFEFLTTFKTVQMYKFNYCGIESINSTDLPSESDLRVLLMAHNSIMKLQFQLFSHTPQIENVDFSYNQISKIHPNTFTGATNLEKINFTHNLIETLDTELFKNSSSLIEIDLSHNLLTTFQLELFNLTNLVSLNLQNNKIVELGCNVFPNAFWTEIFVNVSANRLTKIDLNCNVECQSLILNADDNNLKTVHLPASKITYHLNTLSVSRNKIEKISIDSDLGNLRHLKVANNHLNSVSDVFEHCGYLKTLDLSSNNIRQIKVNAFAKMSQLEYLYLRNINLSSIDCGTFAHPRDLIELDLSENHLTELNFDLFVPSYNNLSKILINNNKLKEMTAWHNYIFPTLQILSVSNNDFNCSYLKEFLRQHKSQRIHLISMPTEQLHSDEIIKIHGISCFMDSSKSLKSFVVNETKAVSVNLRSKVDEKQPRNTTKTIKIIQKSDETDVFHHIKESLIIFVCIVFLLLIFLRFWQIIKENRSYSVKTENSTIYSEVNGDSKRNSLNKADSDA